MNKLDLNYKISTLYAVDPFLQCTVGFDINEGNIYKYIPFRDDIGSIARYSEHETIEAAAQYAIAMALIKLAESK